MVPSDQPVPVQAFPRPKAALDAAWESFFARLMEFKQQHGHFHIPGKKPEHKSLGWWAARQRTHTAAGTILPERLKRLQAAGFPGESLLDYFAAKSWNRTWDEHFAALMEFHRLNGHFDVPRDIGTHGRLREWVDHQRRKYYSGKLKPERRQKLEAAGFPWSSNMRRGPRLKNKISKVPTGDVPTGDVPKGDVPKGDVPKGDVPKGDVPKGDVPKGDVPKGDVPTGDVPTGDVPKGDVPTGDVPTGDVPKGDVPKGDVPKGDVPKGDVPKGDVPKGDVPTAAVPTGNVPTGAVPAGDVPTGTVLAGDVAAPDDPMGDDPRPFDPWDDKFADLAAFHKRFGHCFVPHPWPGQPALGVWVQAQRKERQAGTLSADRIARLDEIHFIWIGGWEVLGEDWCQKQKEVMGRFYHDPETRSEHYRIYRKPVAPFDEEDLESR